MCYKYFILPCIPNHIFWVCQKGSLNNYQQINDRNVSINVSHGTQISQKYLQEIADRIYQWENHQYIPSIWEGIVYGCLNKATLNNYNYILLILWRPVLLFEETGVHVYHRPTPWNCLTLFWFWASLGSYSCSLLYSGEATGKNYYCDVLFAIIRF